MVRLLPHAHAVASGRDLLLLDVRSDAYSILPEAVADGGVARTPLLPTALAITTPAAATLVQAGLAGEEGGSPCAEPRVPILAPPPRRHHLLSRGGRVKGRDLVQLAGCLLRGRVLLSRGMPFRFGRERTTAVAEPRSLDRSLAALAEARLLLPVPARCLPASIVVALFLERRGIAAEIVFGVRTHPFMAHCWVEVGGLLVDDEPERVSAYLPIAVART